jgi:tubulin-specific chaperone C
MHDCRDVDVYLYCTSRPIIEDCEGIRFTELPVTYMDLLGLSPSFPSQPPAPGAEGSVGVGTGAGRGDGPVGEQEGPFGKDSKNLWDQVDDFKWLKSEPSPHWSVLPAEEKVPEETWREVVPGGPGWRVDDILKAVGVRP